MLYTCIQEVLGSDLGRDTGYTGGGFPQDPQEITGITLPHFYKFVIHLSSYHSTLIL
jgi:hypothetical protein